MEPTAPALVMCWLTAADAAWPLGYRCNIPWNMLVTRGLRDCTSLSSKFSRFACVLGNNTAVTDPPVSPPCRAAAVHTSHCTLRAAADFQSGAVGDSIQAGCRPALLPSLRCSGATIVTTWCQWPATDSPTVTLLKVQHRYTAQPLPQLAMISRLLSMHA
jgi:hypothetical protein